MELFIGMMVLSLVLIGLSKKKEEVPHICGNCQERFDPHLLNYFLTVQIRGKKYLRCPRCASWAWSIPVKREKRSWERLKF